MALTDKKAFNLAGLLALVNKLAADAPEALVIVNLFLSLFSAAPAKMTVKDVKVGLGCDCDCGQCIDCSICHQVQALACSVQAAKCWADCNPPPAPAQK